MEIGNAISPDLNAQVLALDVALAAAELDGIIETVPSYRSLLICYDPQEITYSRLVAETHRLLSADIASRPIAPAQWIVPVLYDPPYGEDLPELARRLGLAETDVIARHTAADFRVYTVGFAPGMPYLGGLPKELHISRRETPRPAVSPGAVMIGGVQACIVPTATPSAWYLLGQTPLRPFDLSREDPFLFGPGDRIRFRRIDGVEFARLSSLSPDALLPLMRAPA